ncbi:MAG: zf-HC2 domain-containing protein [Myxococcota bacterium]|nr:zf-HC2 domain-containing protein [Myxococcota bacterium]
MSCKETRKYLDAAVDGELAPERLIEVETHLEACAACRAVQLIKQRMKSELFERGQITAPDHLRASILKTATRRRKTRAAVKIGIAPLAAAAAILIAFNLSQADLEEEPLAAVVEDVVERHVRALPMEVEGPDPNQAASWFRGKVDFPVRTPRIGLRQASFEGARVSNVRSHQAAHMRYKLDGHRISFMIFNPQRISLGTGRTVMIGEREVLLGRRNGFNVAVFLDGDMAYALSSDLSQDRLLELVAQLDR